MRGLRCHQQLRSVVVCCLVIVTLLVFQLKYFIIRKSSNTFSLLQMRYSGLNINRFGDRLHLSQNVCRKFNSSTSHPRTLLYSKRLKMVYCPVPFAFSTWMKQAMLLIESKPLRPKQPYKMSTLHAIHSEAQALNLKRPVLLHPEMLVHDPHHIVIIVRDPWQRLIGAYNEVVVRQQGYKTQCIKFIDAFSRELKFEGFLRCLLYHANGTHTLDRLDPKLSPINSACHICRVTYTTIGKYFQLLTSQSKKRFTLVV